MADTVQVVFEAKDAASAVIQGLVARMGTLGGVINAGTKAFEKNNEALDLYNRALYDTSISVEDVAKAEEEAGAAAGEFALILITAVVEGLKATVNAAVEYNDAIEQMQFITGGTAEEASRLYDVLGRFGLSTTDAEQAFRKMNENGLAPTLENLGALSDQYNALTDPVEKNTFLMDNFGRSSFKMAELMSQGSDALNQYAQSLNPLLIATEESKQKVEEYNMATHDLNNSWMALKVTIGEGVLPTITRSVDVLSVAITFIGGMPGEIDKMTQAFHNASNPIQGVADAMATFSNWAGTIGEQFDIFGIVSSGVADKVGGELATAFLTARDGLQAISGAIIPLFETPQALVTTILKVVSSFQSLVNVPAVAVPAIKALMTALAAINPTSAAGIKSIADGFSAINKDSMDSASKMVDKLTNVDPSNANAAWQAIKNIVNMDGRTITVYVNQVTTSSDSSGGTPTSGSSPTPTSGTTNNFYGPVTLPSFGTTSEMLAGLMG